MFENNEHITSYMNMKKIKSLANMTFYEGKGCDVCNHTGYQSRVGIYEVLDVDDEIRALILQRQPSNIIAQKAIENGMTTMFGDGMEKVVSGVTTISEVFRVAGE